MRTTTTSRAKIAFVLTILTAAAALVAAFPIIRNFLYGNRSTHTDPRIASGEWKIEVQTPPCESAKNLQVIWPKEPGAPVTIECNALPVPVK